MSRKGWHVLREGSALILARRLPARFDVWAETRLAPASRLRLATQIRQDLWRALQGLRGFSPVVEVSALECGVAVKAGGRVEGCFDRVHVRQAIIDVLEAPGNRSRWLRCAGSGR